MIIGFRTRMTTKNETLGIFPIGVHSKIISELDYEIWFRHIQGNSPTDATVEAENFLVPIYYTFDVLFGFRSNPKYPIQTIRLLEKGNLEPYNSLTVIIFSDVRAEPDECFTINILTIGDYSCNEDKDNPDDFFCNHTLCILNDDG